MFFLLSFVFSILDDFLKPIIAIVALVLIAQIAGIDVISMATGAVESFIEQQVQEAISPL
ncbi:MULTISPECIES: hypothetical protein [Halorussus]|uniref:Uncharacterized protein n=2 Tax=Halorussus TaxID=1070314 RepID=A0A8U0HU36_9EURY|nr:MULTISPECIES: hypothetical protein [Halorussus]UPV74575.1 hypothetical protein M0R89_00555 [Halorussus limi]